MRTRQEYIDILKSHADELKSNYGISYMRLFGSVAKNEHHGGSDVDLGTSVDLIRKHNNIRPFFLNQINKYGIDIFGQA